MFLQESEVESSFHGVLELVQTVDHHEETTDETDEVVRGGPESVEVSLAGSSSGSSRKKEVETRLAKKLEEVREGIYRLLSEDSEDEEETGEKIVGDEEVAESGTGIITVDRADTDESLECDISSVIRDDDAGAVSEEVEEKHEYEFSEKETVSEMALGCVGGGGGEGGGRETDSGIVGGSSSRVSSAAGGEVARDGWLARITARVGRFGSAGHSTESSSPELGQDGTNNNNNTMDSPRWVG